MENKDQRIKDTLKMIGLPIEYKKREIKTLSTGEKQKLALAQVLITNPKILVLNNPTQSLDSQSTLHIIKLLKLMKLRYNKNIILTSNDSNILLNLSDEIYLFDNTLSKQNDKYKTLSNSTLLKKCDLKLPNTIEFSKLIKAKTKQNIDKAAFSNA